MKDIFETVVADGSFSTLAEALKNADFVDRLKGEGPITLFAPDDEAFNKLDNSEMLADPEKLVDTLNYHIVEGKLTGEEMRERDCSPTLNGKSLAIKVKHGELVVDNAKVVKTDIECTNGVIHVIDSVFRPQLSGWYGDCGCC
ncbi:MAG: fasciclin domain-containing protein [Geobacteraceae bacterium]|nr:fasciclin domain-containing protein [Geobacteraceae bacterium]